MQPKVTVEHSIWINAPRERAWLAVTDPKQLTQWYATQFAWEIPSLQVGAVIKFYNAADDIVHATIEVVDPPHQFTVRWEPDKTYPAMTLVTSFILEEENGGTRATITESGYEALPEAERQAWVDATDGGYSMSIENLKAHVEGRSLPF
jgi:uncharacterized protein YndB with AHSA1/START domain